MQTPQTEIYDVCKPLLTTRSLTDVEEICNKVFTDDAVFTHPFIISKGKESIIRTYQLWKLLNKQIGFDIENAGRHGPSPLVPTACPTNACLTHVAQSLLVSIASSTYHLSAVFCTSCVISGAE